eukprot:m.169547 g.169547  ORF g.169547 m.169547 type:complete len:1119 (+) comp14498_c0_seq1:399-3755(+)
MASHSAVHESGGQPATAGKFARPSVYPHATPWSTIRPSGPVTGGEAQNSFHPQAGFVPTPFAPQYGGPVEVDPTVGKPHYSRQTTDVSTTLPQQRTEADGAAVDASAGVEHGANGTGNPPSTSGGKTLTLARAETEAAEEVPPLQTNPPHKPSVTGYSQALLQHQQPQHHQNGWFQPEPFDVFGGPDQFFASQGFVTPHQQQFGFVSYPGAEPLSYFASPLAPFFGAQGSSTFHLPAHTLTPGHHLQPSLSGPQFQYPTQHHLHQRQHHHSARPGSQYQPHSPYQQHAKHPHRSQYYVGHQPDSPRVRSNNQSWKDGDWICTTCENHNFSRRVTCNTCRQPRPKFDTAPQLPSQEARTAWSNPKHMPTPSMAPKTRGHAAPVAQLSIRQFCRPCFTNKSRILSPLGNRDPACIKLSHQVEVNPVTAVLWPPTPAGGYSREKQRWVAVRPPPDNYVYDEYFACEFTKSECPRKEKCPHVHTNPPEAEIAYWNLCAPLTDKALKSGQKRRSKPTEEMRQERVEAVTKLQEDIRKTLQRMGGTVSFQTLQSVLSRIDAETIGVTSLLEFLQGCDFVELIPQPDGDFTLTHKLSKADKQSLRIRNVCAACWFRNLKTGTVAVSELTRASQQGIICATCMSPWQPIRVKRSAVTGSYFHIRQAPDDHKLFALCPNLEQCHADDCRYSHHEEELQEWRKADTQRRLATETKKLPGQDRWCVLCEERVPADLEELHDETEFHLRKLDIATRCSTGFRFRLPPTGVQINYKLNLCFKPASCKYDPHKCTHAHSVDELAEWHERRRLARYGHRDVAEKQPDVTFLSSERHTDATTVALTSSLLLACIEGHVDNVEKLLALGAVTNCWDKDGMNPLHIAIQAKQEMVVQLLLHRHCVGINDVTRSSDTGLILACRAGDRRMIQALARHHPKLDIPGKDGRTALHVLADSELNEEFKILMRPDMPVNVRDMEGNTPAHIAAQHGNIILLSLLKDSDANFSIRNQRGFTVSDWASMNNQFEAATWVDEIKSQVDPWRERRLQHQLTDAIESGDAFATTEVTAQMERVTIQGDGSPLHLAVEAGNADVLAALMDAKANPFEPNSAGQTPVEMAQSTKPSAPMTSHLLQYSS